MRKCFIYFVSVSFILCACQKILFNNETGTRELSLDDFSVVKFSGIYNINLVQDSSNRLVITGKNDINSIDAVLNGDTLIIDDHKKMYLNPERNLLSLHFTNLKYVVTLDPVNITNEDTIKADQFLYDGIGDISEVRLVIDCNNLVAVNSANTLGNFYFSGKAGYCSLFNRYGSSIFADKLVSRTTEITNESVGDVYVNATESIIASIRSSGNIYYYGDPFIEIAERTGNGKMIGMD